MRNTIDLIDHNYIAEFDLKDKEDIEHTFVLPSIKFTNDIKSLLHTRAVIKKILNTNPMDKNLIKNIDRIDKHVEVMRSAQAAISRDFQNILEKKWNDQTIIDAPIPQQVQYKNDVYTSEGIDIIGAQITSKSFVRWEWIRWGTGTKPASLGDQGLQNPVGAYPIDEGGSFTSIGDQIRLFVILPEEIQDASISEFSINELQEGGKTLSRTVFSTPIEHTMMGGFPTISNTTYIIPHIE